MTTRTVTGTWLYPDGTPARGQIVFTPTCRVVDRAADQWAYNPGMFSPQYAVAHPDQPAYPVGVPASMAVDLDATGSVSVDLTVTPADESWHWSVIEKIIGVQPPALYRLIVGDDPLNDLHLGSALVWCGGGRPCVDPCRAESCNPCASLFAPAPPGGAVPPAPQWTFPRLFGAVPQPGDPEYPAIRGDIRINGENQEVTVFDGTGWRPASYSN